MAAASKTIRTALAAALAIVAVGAQPAAALVPSSITTNAGHVGAFLERGGIPGNNPYDVRAPAACATFCDDLWLAEHRPMPNQPPSKALHNELRRLRFKAKLVPAYSKLPYVGLGLTVGLAGFSIGTEARKLFFAEEMPATGSNPGELSGAAGTTGATQTFSGLTPVNPEWQIDQTFFGAEKWPSDGWAAVRYTGFPEWKESFAKPWGGYAFVPASLVSIFPGTRDGFNSQVAFKPSAATPPQSTPVEGVTTQYPNVEFPTWSDYSGSSSTVSNAAQAELANNEARYPTLIPWMDSQMGGPSSDPTVNTATVPSCSGDSYTACITKLEDAGFMTHTRTTRTFTGADVEQPADAVLDWNPKGSNVETTATITVDTNPPPATMPLVLPAPGVNETYATYTARLQALGYLGTVTRVDLSDTSSDPTHGPSAVTTTSPASGTRVLPSSDLTVRVNPETAPEVAGSGGTGNPAIHVINLAPLNVAGLCDNFPFGVPCWLYDVMSSWVVGTPDPPSWEIPFPFVAAADRPSIDLADWDAWAPQLRALILLVAAVGIALKFYALATGQSRGGDGD